MRLPIIAVLGGGANSVPDDDDAYPLAVQVGEFVAIGGAILLCGGGTGIMKGAAQGAKAKGGKVLAIMPSRDARERRPNLHVDEAIYTGLGDGRNYLTAGLPDAAIAMKGEAGTLSEIGLALKLRTPLVLCAAWAFVAQHFKEALYTENPSDAVSMALASVSPKQGYVDSAVRVRNMPAQDENMKAVVRIVDEWSRKGP